MKEFVEKLISRLEEIPIENTCGSCPHKGKCDEVQEYVTNETTDLCGATIKALAIDIINELAEEYIPCTKSCTDCEAYDLTKHNCPKFCKVIKETVEEVKENHNNGWIPCSERLPQLYEKTSDVVLVCNNDDYQHMAFWCSDGKWRYCQSGMIKEPMDWTKIVAWQPLPQPYKEGSGENERN